MKIEQHDQQYELSWDEICKKLDVNEAKIYRQMLNTPTVNIIELNAERNWH